MRKLEDETVPPPTCWQEKGHPQWLMLLQLLTQSEIKCQILITTKKNFLNKKKLKQNQASKLVASETKQEPPLNVWPVGFKGGPAREFPP